MVYLGLTSHSTQYRSFWRRDSDITFRVKGHQAALLNAALTREEGAAVTVGTYWAWETTATLRLIGGARSAGAPTGGGEGRGHIVPPHAQLVRLLHNIECRLASAAN